MTIEISEIWVDWQKSLTQIDFPGESISHLIYFMTAIYTYLCTYHKYGTLIDSLEILDFFCGDFIIIKYKNQHNKFVWCRLHEVITDKKVQPTRKPINELISKLPWVFPIAGCVVSIDWLLCIIDVHYTPQTNLLCITQAEAWCIKTSPKQWSYLL